MLSNVERVRCWIDTDALWAAARRRGVERGNASALAVVLGVAPQTMSRILAGERQPGYHVLMRFRIAFGDRAFLRIWRCEPL